MWGAFGNAPVDAQPAGAGRGAAPFDIDGPGPQQFGGPVHAVKVSNDELVYVADRQNRRLQVFSPAGKYIAQTFINRTGPANGSVAGIAFSPDRAQQFMYLADYGNSHIVVMDRKSLDDPLPVRYAERRGRRLPGRCITWRRTRRAISSWSKSRPGTAFSVSASRGSRTRCRPMR